MSLDRATFPPGLVGDAADYLYSQAAYPNGDIALAGAIGFMSGLCGQRYNTVTGVGLNQYILVLAFTGRGKEAIAEGVSRLLEAIKAKVPTVQSFKGPSHFASAEGLLKQLSRSACFASILGEFGLLLRALIAPNANGTQLALKRTLLDLYNKSGDGKVLDPMVYSDAAKNTLPVLSPAFTVIGESTPQEFFDGIDERVITNGLATRFMVFHTEAPRPYLNPNVGKPPSPELVDRLADLAARCCGYSPTLGAVKVQLDDEAKETFRLFERQTTDCVNANTSSVHTELWNRAFIKALKLASLVAVGVNSDFPTVTLHMAEQSIALVCGQIEFLTGKFANGEFGEEAGNQTKQQRLVLWAMCNFVENYIQLEKFFPGNRGYEYASEGVVPYAHISQRIAGYAAFKNDRRFGAREALKRTIQELLDTDFIREVPPQQMGAKFGGKGRGFVMADPHAIKQVLSRT